MKKLLCIFGGLLVVLFAVMANASIGSEADIAKVLGITVDDIQRMKTAVGTHQHLVDANRQRRDATLKETIEEMIGRMNELVIHEEQAEQQKEVLSPIESIEVK